MNKGGDEPCALVAYHRNGITGIPFYVKASIDGLSISFEGKADKFGEETYGPAFTVSWEAIKHPDNRQCVRIHDPDGTPLIAIVGPSHDKHAIAVFDPALLPNVAFAVNSWRGDRFIPDVRRARDEQQSAGALSM